MATKRTPIKRSAKARITPAAVAAYRIAHEILNAGAEEAWEDEGGMRRTYLDALRTVHRELGLKPWEESPVTIPLDGGAPDYMRNDHIKARTWTEMQVLGRALGAAAFEETA